MKSRLLASKALFQRTARQDRWAILGRLAIAAAGALCLLWPADLEAQGEGDLAKRLVTLTKKPTSRKDSKGWSVSVEGKAPLLPAGTKVRFILTWMSQPIETFTVKLGGDKVIREEFKVKKAPISPIPFQFRTEVHSRDCGVCKGRDQSRSVRDAMEKNKEAFPPSLDPWTDYHNDFKFQIASDQEIDAAMTTIRAFFTERYTKLGKLDVQVQGDLEKAKEGEAYKKGDEFDAKKWVQFIDKEVLTVIGPIQKEIEEKIKEEEFRPYRLSLVHLREIATAVAFRSTRASIDLHEHHGLSAPASHVKPEEVKIKTRQRNPKSRYLRALVSKINEQLGIVKKKDPDKGKEDEKTPEKGVGKKEGA